MEWKLFSIMVEGKENAETGFLQSFKVRSNNKKSAIDFILSQDQFKGKEILIEEIEELEDSPISFELKKEIEIIESTGKIFFSY